MPNRKFRVFLKYFSEKSSEDTTVSHIPDFGDTPTSPFADVRFPAGDTAFLVRDVHLQNPRYVIPSVSDMGHFFRDPTRPEIKGSF